MKSSLFLFLLFLCLACSNTDKQSSAAENNIDAARTFIRAALDGKFDEARRFMLADSVNTNYMDIAERSYQRADQATRDGYRASAINIHEVKAQNDSTTIVIFSNSFKNDHDTLKILQLNSQWLVDLKYLYGHDRDTVRMITPHKDSLDSK